jgi:hypothetical protein
MIEKILFQFPYWLYNIQNLKMLKCFTKKAKKNCLFLLRKIDHDGGAAFSKTLCADSQIDNPCQHRYKQSLLKGSDLPFVRNL